MNYNKKELQQSAKLAKVEIKNRFGKIITKKSIYPKSIQIAAQKFSELHPDCYVTVISQSGEQVKLTPINMRKDEYKILTGHLDLEDFMMKWMPGKQVNSKLVQQEVESEFSIDESLDLDPYAADRPYQDCNGDD